MFFSVIVPIYNVEKYLEECIESVLKQSFKDYELILVDDGSNDESGKICDSYANQYSQISVIHKSNGGLSDARNVGTKSANGKYIIYVDSDDYILDSLFLQDVYDKAQDKDYDLILYKFQKFYDGKSKLLPCAFSMASAEKIDDSDELLLDLVKEDAYYGAAWLKAIKRTALIESGVEFEKGLLGEDMEWYCHLLTCVKTIAALDKPYIAYRQRKGSISKTNKLKNLTDYIYVLEKWSVGIEKAHISETRKEALRGALARYYANLLITYLRVNDPKKKNHRNRVKALHNLLNHSKSKRPQTIKKVYSLLGFDGTLLALKLIDKMKG